MTCVGKRCDARGQVTDTTAVHDPPVPAFPHWFWTVVDLCTYIHIKMQFKSSEPFFLCVFSTCTFELIFDDSLSWSHTQTTCPDLQICKVLKCSSITCNPRGQPQSACTQSHSVYHRVRWSTRCCTWRVCLHAVASWKGWCHTPGIPMLLWKQGSCSSQ